MKYVDSSSAYQRQIEKIIFSEIQKSLGADLVSNVQVPINSTKGIYINPDFYSKERRIIGEIHTHAGRLKGGQPKKIAGDILKMLLHDKVNHCEYTKYIVVCDQEEYDQLTGNNMLAETIRQFDIHVLLIPLDEKMHETLREVMKKQSFL